VSAERGKRLAVVAAVLLVAAIVVAVQFARLGRQPAPEIAGPDDPPAGVQLLYFLDQTRPHRVVAYDWAGRRRGSLDFPLWVDVSHLRPSPDGSAFMLDPQSFGDYAAYFDRRGRIQLETDEPAFISQAWASDGRHVCVVFGTDNGPSIVTRMPGTSDRIALLGMPADLTAVQIVPWTCDLRSDTAELAVQSSAGGWHVVRVKLSNGTLVHDRDVGDAPTVVSRDGGYLAVEGSVYRTSDMAAPVAGFNATAAPLAFSGDDSLLLLGFSDSIEVLDWKGGKVLWRTDVPGAYGPWLSQPGGEDFAIALNGRGGVTPTVVIAHRDGSTTTIGARDPLAW
jgi:hypothetical protein